MKKQPRLTKRERKALHGGPRPAHPEHERHDHDHDHDHGDDIGAYPQMADGTHLHCVSCGKHLDTAGEARAKAARGAQSNLWMAIRCAHGTEFYSCMGCLERSKQLLDEHDRTGGPVAAANAWH